MNIFPKKPSMADLPFPQRCKALTDAIYGAMKEHAVVGLNAAKVLEGIASNERARIAMVAPLASARPTVYDGNVKPGAMDRLRDLISGGTDERGTARKNPAGMFGADLHFGG